MRQQGRDQDPDPGTFDYTTVKPGDGFYKITAVEPLVAGKGCMGLHPAPQRV